VQYFFSATFYFVGFSIAIYLLLPILYLLFGISPVQARTSGEWLLHYIPFFAVFYALPVFLSGRLSLSLISTSIATFWPYLQAFIDTVVSRRYKWVTTASKSFTVRDQPALFIWPHLMLIALSIAGVLVAWVQVADPLNTTINSFWAIVNAVMLGIFVNHTFISREDAALNEPALAQRAISAAAAGSTPTAVLPSAAPTRRRKLSVEVAEPTPHKS